MGNHKPVKSSNLESSLPVYHCMFSMDEYELQSVDGCLRCPGCGLRVL